MIDTIAEASNHNRGSLPGKDSDEWRTPIKVVRALERHLRLQFIMDMAATDHNAICPIYFTKEDDALAQGATAVLDKIRAAGIEPDPRIHALWCNPPYGSTGLDPWIEQASLVSKVSGLPWVFLLPASRSEQDWLYLRPAADYEVIFMRRRVPYLRPDGTPGKAPNHPSFSIAFPGKNDAILGGSFTHLDWKKEKKPEAQAVTLGTVTGRIPDHQRNTMNPETETQTAPEATQPLELKPEHVDTGSEAQESLDTEATPAAAPESDTVAS